MNKTRHLVMAPLSLIVLVLGSLLLPGRAPAAAVRGTGPDDALVPSTDWQELAPGVERWYAFYYMGDGSPIEIRLRVEPEEGAAFDVWTPDNIRDWAAGAEVEPIGGGSPHANVANTLIWSGGFQIPGTYYVVVEHAGSQPGSSYYLLEIEGDGVSFEPPPPSTEAKPEPVSPGPQAAPAKPTGKLVFQTTFGGDFYTINADGSGLRRITDGVDPIWSPDGGQIAFARWREPRGVWVVDAGGSNERRAFDWNQARWPSWSADGLELLFSRMTGKGRQEDVEFCFRGFCFSFPANPHWRLGLVRLDDGSFREPPSSEITHAPMWSPDGSRVVYDDVQGLWLQSLDMEVSYLITGDPRDTGPAWSPDGGRVAFTRRQHDHWEIYSVDTEGRGLKRLTDTPKKPGSGVGNSAAPAWSPDGAYIAFLSDRTGRWEIWVMRSDGSGQRPMFPGGLDGLRLEYGALSERAISWTR